MKVLNQPNMPPIAMGDLIKALLIEGRAGTRIPHHCCNNESIIVVQEGLALLSMPDSQQLLGKGDSFIVPAKKEQTLKILQDFKALVIMTVESEINFI